MTISSNPCSRCAGPSQRVGLCNSCAAGNVLPATPPKKKWWQRG